MCNEEFSSIVLIKKEECHRYYTEKTFSKKFSAENNMDPDEVSEELQGLTKIKEMLIV